MARQRIRIRLKAYDHRLLDQSALEIVETAEPRIVLTVDELGKAGEGLVAHLLPAEARRVRVALRDALKEIGEDLGS